METSSFWIIAVAKMHRDGLEFLVAVLGQHDHSTVGAHDIEKHFEKALEEALFARPLTNDFEQVIVCA